MTPEGYLRVDATVTRTGVFKYRNDDGSIRNELRHPDDVLKADSLATMEMLPITLNHPKEKTVTSKNSSKLAVGFTGEKVTNDGRLINTNLKITDEKAIAAVNDGIQELSLGYSCVLLPEGGDFNGERYDCRQTEIIYNHLALVKYGRAGAEAKLHLDSGDAVQHTDDNNNDNKLNSNKKKEINMSLVKVTVGGLEYDAAPEVKIALDNALNLAGVTQTKLDEVAKEAVVVKANLDAANETIKAAKDENPQLKIDEAVKTRIDLERVALKHLGSEIKLDEMSNAEIKKACILKHFPEAKLDEAEDAYIDARFDGVLELKEDGKHIEDPKKKIGSQRQAMKTNNDGKDIKIDSDASRERMIKNLTNPETDK